MGSRLRLDPEHLFEVFFEFAKPTDNTDICVLQTFPDNYSDIEVLKSVPKFVFPYETYQASHPVEHFTFVLTDINSQFKFGFCRLSAGTTPHACLCIVSCLPWTEVFYTMLDNISNCVNNSKHNSVVPLLSLLYGVNNFTPNEPVDLVDTDTDQKYSFIVPVVNQLPSVPENTNLTTFINSFDLHAVLLLFACLINERRVLMVSESLSRLTSCIHAAAAIIYPMYWQHLLIPVLPPVLLDYCCAPMPFLIGLHSTVMKRTRRADLGDVVVVDVDSGTVTSEYNDLELLPDDVVSTLKRSLKSHIGDNKVASRVGDGISRAFLKAMVMMIGGYRDALRFRPGEQITFDPDAFLLSRPAGMHAFLERALQLQTFQQFVNDRLEMLNSGVGFSDEFDTEVNLYGDQWGAQSRYKDWLSHMKKQGRKFKKEGRDRWLDFAGKVRNRSKKTFKELKARIEDMKKEEAESAVRRHASQQRRQQQQQQLAVAYHTAPKPPRPPPPNMSHGLGPTPTPRQSLVRRSSTDRVQRYRIMDIADDSLVVNGATALPRRPAVAVDDSVLYEPTDLPSVDLDLSHDPDILKVCRKSYSLEDLAVETASGYTTTDTESESSPSWPSLNNIQTTSSAYLPVPPALTTVSSVPNLETRFHDVTTDISLPAPVPAPRRTRIKTPLQHSPDLSAGVESSGFGVEPRTMRAESVTMRAGLVTPRAESSRRDEPLILLDSSTSSSEQLAVGSTGSLDYTGLHQFDPLNNDNSLLGSVSTDSVSGGGSKMFGAGLRISGSVPVPRPRSSKRNREVVAEGLKLEHDTGSATSRDTSPSCAASCRALAQDSARAMFIQSAAPATVCVGARQTSLDQFDPLASGQLAVDHTATLDTTDKQNDDLLKEWNLDFGRLTLSGPSVCGLRPANSAASNFVSMPNLSRSDAASFNFPSGLPYRPGGGPGLPAGGMVVGYGYRSPQSQWLMGPHGVVGTGPPAMLPPGVVRTTGGLPSTTRCATLPVGLLTLPTFSQPSLTPTQNCDIFAPTKQSSLTPLGTIDSTLRPHSSDLEGLFTTSLPDSTTLPSRHSMCQTNWEKFE